MLDETERSVHDAICVVKSKGCWRGGEDGGAAYGERDGHGLCGAIGGIERDQGGVVAGGEAGGVDVDDEIAAGGAGDGLGEDGGIVGAELDPRGGGGGGVGDDAGGVVDENRLAIGRGGAQLVVETEEIRRGGEACDGGAVGDIERNGNGDTGRAVEGGDADGAGVDARGEGAGG